MAEAHTVRLVNGATAATNAPSAATDGYAPADTYQYSRAVGMQLQYTVAAGSGTARLVLWGYNPTMRDTAGAAIGSSGAWYQLYDTDTLSYSANTNEAFCVEHAEGYTRFAVQLSAITGTNATVTAAVSFTEEAS